MAVLTVLVVVAAAVELAGELLTWCRSTEILRCKFRKRLDRNEIGIEK